MKILLTGIPGIGKSTIVQKVATQLKKQVYGIVSKEVRSENGSRDGFEAYDFQGNKVLFAHISQIQSQHVIGDKYHVDLEAIDNFVVPELKAALKHENSPIIIDEIGRMQSLSKKFIDVVSKIFDSRNPVLGTIVLDDEPWSLQFKNHNVTIIIKVTKNNREDLVPTLVSIFNSNKEIYELSPQQLKFVKQLLLEYLNKNQYLQIQKLMDNAIHYITQNEVALIDKNKESATYSVKGFTQNHQVIKQKSGKWICDCKLFNGLDLYAGKAGTCSHIQSVMLFELS